MLRTPPLGNGIINADGELWKIQRKAGLRFFSNANLKTLIEVVLPPIFADTEILLDDASRNRNILDLQTVLLDLTTRLMGNMAYDVCGYIHSLSTGQHGTAILRQRCIRRQS